MKKILIFTASYGEGHNAAARGLCSGFQHTGAADAEVIDVFARTYGDVYERTRSDYLHLIDRAPKLWAAMYGVLDRTPLVHAIIPTLGKMQKRLAALLDEHQPAAVVSTYPIYNYVLNKLASRRVQRPFRQYTVVTDSITVNSVWFRCDTDAFFLPNDDTSVAMRRSGVPAEKLRVLGFPVPPRFALDRSERKPFANGEPLRVLYMINAGKVTAPAVIERVLKVSNVALTVTVGRDEELRRKVEAISERLGIPIEIHGWTPKMPELLMTNHILIGKAGGAAVQEAIAAQTPMIITHVVPGQEEGNARLLLENNCGCLATTPDAIASALELAMADGGRTWCEWDRNVAALSRPDAAIKIASSILGES